jgi:uncharacterized protein (TIGR02996 family)
VGLVSETTVTDGDALIRSVLATPADDAPRLVYADWLEEQGRDEDAEFIRVQVELARLGFDGAFHVDALGRLQRLPGHIERLQDRQLELWMGGRGRPDLPDELQTWAMYVHNPHGQSLRVRRGFVERIASFADVFFEVAAGLFAHQPVVQVRLIDLHPLAVHDGYLWDRAHPARSRTASHELPPELWDALFEAGVVRYPTADEADAALSWACVQFGRARAGLGGGS